MKNGTNKLILAGLLLGQVATANEPSTQSTTNPARFTRDQVKAALIILLESGALVLPEIDNQCPTVDIQIIEELRQEGYIKMSGTTPSSICINAEK